MMFFSPSAEALGEYFYWRNEKVSVTFSPLDFVKNTMTQCAYAVTKKHAKV
jgi:hypothetical protein